MEPWSPGKVTGGLSSRSASATAARWASCPPEASPMPTTILAGPARNAATSGTKPVRGGKPWARKNSRLPAMRDHPSSISGGRLSLGLLGRGVGQPDDLLEPLHARLDAVAAVGLIHVLHGRPDPVGVGQQL